MSPPLVVEMLHPDGTFLDGPILGRGRTGIVVRRDKTALKLPLKYRVPSGSEAQINLFNTYAEISWESLQDEKKVYRRLGSIPGVVPCIDLSGDGIQMALMENGDLHDYLTRNRPTKQTQLSWFREMARGLIHIHDRCVIVADIASRNFLLDADLSVKYSDFTESTILPLGTDMEAADDSGFSIYTDIGDLGAVMYEVVTGNPCKFDLFKGQPSGPARAAWPQREDLPITTDIWLGSVIEKCWTKGDLQNARDLLAALDSETL